jgi:hypothetical protein
VTGDLASLDVVPDGAEVLDEVRAILTRYVVFPTPEAADAATLYAAATHVANDLEFASRLVIKSPVKRCGKSRLLDVLAQLVRNPLATADISAAALVRSVTEDDPPTIMLDEADAIFGKGLKGDEKAEHLRGILNAGFGRDRPYKRWDITTRTVEDCPTFALAVIAGIGAMPDTIEDRAVVLTLRRKAPHEAVQKYRTRRDKPAVRAVGDRLAAWIVPRAADVGKAEPDMPPGMNDRAEDVWEALIAVADLAGAAWPLRARSAAQVLTAASESAAAGSSLALTLLTDLRTVFGAAERLPTSVILERLRNLDESPWSSIGKPPRPLEPSGLSYRLKDYGIKPKVIRLGEQTARGYYRAELADVWDRYLPRGEDRNDRNDRNDAGQGDDGRYGVTPHPVTPSHDQGSDQDRYGVTSVTATPTPLIETRPCEVCGEPMAVVEPGQRWHPNCQPAWPEGSVGEEVNS